MIPKKQITLTNQEIASLHYSAELTLKCIKELLSTSDVEIDVLNTICEISTGLMTAIKKLR